MLRLPRWMKRTKVGASDSVAVPKSDSFQADAALRSTYWETYFNQADPWGYGSAYEQVKYERSLTLLSGLDVGTALELACAEGHFTEKLATRVQRLEATDISNQAIERAAERCAGLRNLRFRQLDFMADDVGAGWDLIVCSEVLYYTGGRERLEQVCEKLMGALRPGGHLLTANAYVLADDATRTGFEWGDYGAQTIMETLSATPELRRVKSIETEIYRIDLFQRPAGKSAPTVPAQVTLPTGPLPLEAPRRSLVRWGALTSRVQARSMESSGDVPVLMYHRISREGPPGLARWRVSPDEFERQIRFLARRGFGSVTIEAWTAACESGEWLAGRPVMLTFDDGYVDFLEEAWPILEHYEFTAHVFIVTGLVGQRASWDAASGTPAPLLNWADIQTLSAAGCGFGSHLESHTRADRLDDVHLRGEAERSRAALELNIGRPIRSVCLPHDYTDARVTRGLTEAGYSSIFGVRPGVASIHQPTTDIPRLEIHNETSLEMLARYVGREDQPPDARDRTVALR